MIRVVVAEDQDVVRAGLKLLLDGEPDLSVVGEAGDGVEAIATVRRTEPDVVVMDLQMPVTDGVEATRSIVSGFTTSTVPRVLALTTFDDDDLVHAALRAGAVGYLLKTAAARDLPEAVRHVARGEGWLDPAVTSTVLAALNDAPRSGHMAHGALRSLTAREQEILRLAAEGLSNAEIAVRLTLSPATVKTHLSRILMKSGAGNRARLVAMAYQSGLVVPPPGADR